MTILKTENILSLFLGFVVIWFGVNEVMHPASWSAFVPDFVKNISLGLSLDNLVIMHGIVLCISGLMLIFNRFRRFAATLIALMLLEIILHFIFTTGLDEIAVRDIGLLGMALVLAIKRY